MDNCTLPSLRISTCASCNCRCSFCQVHGDFASDYAQLDSKTDTQLVEFFIESISRFWKLGIRHFSFTGGEPLLNQYVTLNVAEYLRNRINESKLSDAECYLRLNTNGIFLGDCIDQVHQYFDLIKISLNSLEKTNFKKITSSIHLNSVLDSIRILNDLNHPMRIQTVVLKENYDEVNNLIEFCEKFSSVQEIKLFDLSQYSELWRGDVSAKKYWREQFVDIKKIEDSIAKKSNFIGQFYSVGGYGNPMNVYQLKSGLKIRFRNSFKGAHFSEHCQTCTAFEICKDGHCNLEIGPNKVIKVCRPKEGKIFYPGDEIGAIAFFCNTKFINFK